MKTMPAVLLAAATLACGVGPAPLPFYTDASFTPEWRETPARPLWFALRSQRDHAFTDHDLRGRVHVASFIYTRCSVVCPVLVERLRPVQAALAARPDVRMVSFSVTPDADTPERLAAFGAVRGIDPSRWTLATGSQTQIRRLARWFYFADDGRLGEDEFLHTEKVLLVDQLGRLRGVYNGTLAADIERLLKDIDALRAV